MNNLKKILETDKKNYNKLLKELSGIHERNGFCPDSKRVSKISNFIDEKTKIIGGYTYFVLDDEDAYSLLFDKIKMNKDYILENGKVNDEHLCQIVQNAVFDYYGSGKPDDYKRELLYNDAYKDGNVVSIKNFKNSGNSMCLERATLAHNYFVLLGLKDELVGGSVIFNGTIDLHTFNVVETKNGKYIFDLVCSKVTNEPMPSPIIKRLDKEKEYKDEAISFVSQSGKLNSIQYKKKLIEKSDEHGFTM